MAAQRQDVLATERVLIPGSITAGDIADLSHKLAQISNGTSTNANNNDWTEVPLTVVDEEDVGHFTVVGNGIRCDFDGRVKITAHLAATSSVQRASPGIRLQSTGTINQNVQGLTGYIRAVSGHNNSTSSIPGYLASVINGDIITMQSQRQGSAGTANTIIGGCYLLLERY